MIGIGEMIIVKSALFIGFCEEGHMAYSANFCIHMKTWAGSLYEPPESWCELNSEYSCDDCPYQYSKEDYECDYADFRMEIDRDRFDF